MDRHYEDSNSEEGFIELPKGEYHVREPEQSEGTSIRGFGEDPASKKSDSNVDPLDSLGTPIPNINNAEPANIVHLPNPDGEPKRSITALVHVENPAPLPEPVKAKDLDELGEPMPVPPRPQQRTNPLKEAFNRSAENRRKPENIAAENERLRKQVEARNRELEQAAIEKKKSNKFVRGLMSLLVISGVAAGAGVGSVKLYEMLKNPKAAEAQNDEYKKFDATNMNKLLGVPEDAYVNVDAPTPSWYQTIRDVDGDRWALVKDDETTIQTEEGIVVGLRTFYKFYDPESGKQYYMIQSQNGISFATIEGTK